MSTPKCVTAIWWRPNLWQANTTPRVRASSHTRSFRPMNGGQGDRLGKYPTSVPKAEMPIMAHSTTLRSSSVSPTIVSSPTPLLTSTTCSTTSRPMPFRCDPISGRIHTTPLTFLPLSIPDTAAPPSFLIRTLIPAVITSLTTQAQIPTGIWKSKGRSANFRCFKEP